MLSPAAAATVQSRPRSCPGWRRRRPASCPPIVPLPLPSRAVGTLGHGPVCGSTARGLSSRTSLSASLHWRPLTLCAHQASPVSRASLAASAVRSGRRRGRRTRCSTLLAQRESRQRLPLEGLPSFGGAGFLNTPVVEPTTLLAPRAATLARTPSSGASKRPNYTAAGVQPATGSLLRAPTDDVVRSRQRGPPLAA